MTGRMTLEEFENETAFIVKGVRRRQLNGDEEE